MLIRCGQLSTKYFHNTLILFVYKYLLQFTLMIQCFLCHLHTSRKNANEPELTVFFLVKKPLTAKECSKKGCKKEDAGSPRCKTYVCKAKPSPKRGIDINYQKWLHRQYSAFFFENSPHPLLPIQICFCHF